MHLSLSLCAFGCRHIWGHTPVFSHTDTLSLSHTHTHTHTLIQGISRFTFKILKKWTDECVCVCVCVCLCVCESSYVHVFELMIQCCLVLSHFLAPFTSSLTASAALLDATNYREYTSTTQTWTHTHTHTHIDTQLYSLERSITVLHC